jgi:hypothetical protein
MDNFRLYLHQQKNKQPTSIFYSRLGLPPIDALSMQIRLIGSVVQIWFESST